MAVPEASERMVFGVTDSPAFERIAWSENATIDRMRRDPWTIQRDASGAPTQMVASHLPPYGPLEPIPLASYPTWVPCARAYCERNGA